MKKMKMYEKLFCPAVDSLRGSLKSVVVFLRLRSDKFEFLVNMLYMYCGPKSLLSYLLIFKKKILYQLYTSLGNIYQDNDLLLRALGHFVISLNKHKYNLLNGLP